MIIYIDIAKITTVSSYRPSPYSYKKHFLSWDDEDI